MAENEPVRMEIPLNDCSESGVCFGDLVRTTKVAGVNVETAISVQASISTQVTAGVRLPGQAWRSVKVRSADRSGLTDAVMIDGETKSTGPQSSLTPGLEIGE